ncbi:MAG: VWA domain-containing protein [Terriglobia bacterium]
MSHYRVPHRWLLTQALVLGLLLLPLLWAPAALPQQPAPPSEQKKGPLKPKEQKSEEEGFAMRVDVPLVSVDVVVTDRKGNFIPNLQKENFRIVEEGVEQSIASFAPSQAPLTTVLLLETTPKFWRVYYDTLDAAYLFLNRLRKDDWIALVGFHLKPEILVDFTRDKRKVAEALRRLEVMYGFREANTFDALLDTLERLRDVEGKRSIVLVGTGLNTFSRHSWDETLRRVREAESGVSIFILGMSWTLELYADLYNDTSTRMNVLVSKGQLTELAKQTGGRAYFPRFLGEIPGIYEQIAAMLRNQYTLAYQPKNFQRDGKFHKLKVELVAPNGQPLKIVNEKGKRIKVRLYHRRGYYAPKGIEVSDARSSRP